MDRKEQRRLETIRLKKEEPEEYRRQRELNNARNREYYQRRKNFNLEAHRARGRKAAAKAYADPEKRIKIRERNLQIMKRKKEWFQELKSSLKCEECGAGHPGLLLFHHRKTDEKTNPVSVMVSHKHMAKEKILKEIDKCNVLCHNCHGVFHYIYGVKNFPEYKKGMIINESGRYKEKI